MTESRDLLLSTLLSLPDEQRAEVERLLVPLARATALGEVAADVVHDIANPLFGAIGLVDLLLGDADPASDDAARLRLLKDTTLEMKDTLQVLTDFARGDPDASGQSSLEDAVRSALLLLRHSRGHELPVEERYLGEPVLVPCPAAGLTQAVLQLLLAARTAAGLAVEVSGTTLRIVPPPAESVGTLVAERIVADHGGRFVRAADSLSVAF